MVHSGFGTARITYPTTVKLSPADPMTNANIPAALLAVPGVVSRPIRLGYTLVAKAPSVLHAPSAYRPYTVPLHPELGTPYIAKMGPYTLARKATRMLGDVGYYPNLGQDVSSALALPAAGLPTWVWLAGAGVLAVLVLPLLFRGRAAARVPKVRTVTRTTF